MTTELATTKRDCAHHHNVTGMRDFSRSLPMALLRAREQVMTRFRPVLREYNITEQQWRVLRALIEYGDLEITALAKRCCILSPSLTRILQKLEERGLLERQPVSGDQRRASIALTRDGRDLFATIAPHSETEYAVIAQSFGEANLEALYGLLDDLQRALEGNEAQDD